MKKLKELLIFENEAQENMFLASNDVTEYFDMKQYKFMPFANLEKII